MAPIARPFAAGRDRQLKPTKTTMDFFDFDEFEAVADAAAKIDPRALLIVLLGGEASSSRSRLLGSAEALV
jgi:hypothetical protein